MAPRYIILSPPPPSLSLTHTHTLFLTLPPSIVMVMNCSLSTCYTLLPDWQVIHVHQVSFPPAGLKQERSHLNSSVSLLPMMKSNNKYLKNLI